MLTRSRDLRQSLGEVGRLITPRTRRYARPGTLAARLHGQGTSPALNVIDQALIDLTRSDEHDALAVFMPPQEGKSQRVSRVFAEWLLDNDPSLRIAIVSYSEDLSVRWGRDIKMDISQRACESGQEGCREPDGLHIEIRRDSSAAGRWQTPQGGGVYCVGVGGPLTGQPVDILIIDDPVKDRAAAESKTIRESTWDWWESVALARLAPNAKVVLIQTRWHEDDLAGRIAARPSPLRWKVLRIPAIADAPDDPLGRKPGEELPSVRGRKPGHFRNLRANMSPYVFAGVYNQKPVAPEGNFFRRSAFRYWRPMEPWSDGRERLFTEAGPVTLADCWTFVTMDFAASTRTDADYTTAACWAVTPAGDLILLDRIRNQVADHDHFTMVLPMMQRWNPTMIYVEHNWWAQTFVTDARDKGWAVAPVVADTDKVTRAIPAAGRVHSGRVYFPAETSGCPCGHCPEGNWLDEWCDELAIFPQGSHDDQVDTLSYAVRVLVHQWTQAPEPPRPGLDPYEQQLAQAQASATGSSSGLDIMNTPW